MTDTDDRIVSFDLALYTVDGCENSFQYFLGEDRKISRTRETGWTSPPLGETESAMLTIHRLSGEEANFLLTGSQHRDLEAYDLYDSFLESVAAGKPASGALVEALGVVEKRENAARPSAGR